MLQDNNGWVARAADFIDRLGLGMRIAALAIWLPSVYLAYIMMVEFTGAQTQVIFGAAMMALAVSSVALVMWRNAKDAFFGRSALAMYAVAVLVMALFESGFWSSSVMSGNARAQRAVAAVDGVELIRERQRESIRTGKVAETAAEIQAKMDVQLSQPIGAHPLSRLTNNCEDKSAAAFRLCGEYLTLKAAKAKAERAEQIEDATWKNGTSIETSALRKNIFAGAENIHNATGVGSPELFAALFSFLIVLLLTLTRDLALCGVFAPLGPSKLRSAPVRSAPIARAEAEDHFRQDVKRVLGDAVAGMAERIAEPAERATQEPVATKAPEPKKTPPAGGPGPRNAAPAPAASEPPAQAENVLRMKLARDDASVFEQPAKVRQERGRAKGRAAAWLDERTDRVQDIREVCEFDAAWADYKTWCGDEGLNTIPKSQFIRAVRARIGSTGHGFIGLVLCANQVREKVRAYG